MGKETSRRAKITPETMAESALLRQLWATREHPSQAEFGEQYGVGNQSAVGQFLRGEVPLSLKAARGFAQGLGCRIEDFSPRLAAEAASLAGLFDASPLSPPVREVARELDKLPPRWRDWALIQIRSTIEVAQQSAEVESARNASPVRRSSAK